MAAQWWLLLWSAPGLAQQPSPEQSPEAVEFFENRIRPVLVERCYKCHSSESEVLQGGLRVDASAPLLKGGDSGAAIVPGKPGESLLLEALQYKSLEMPPDGKLPDAVIADFETWIAHGAVDPRQGESTPSGKPTVVDAKTHWSFQDPTRPSLPPVKHPVQARSPIDTFILARLEAANIAPSPPADPRVLLRRLFYDLTGLPPTADELTAFAARSSDAAYEETVDRLLNSPRFGERWARHWLDVARYADTKGYVFEEDRNYPNAYKYRDWVIAAFNGDLAFDRFAIAQLAADQLNDATLLPAMGFLTLGRRFLNDPTLINDDRIDLMTRGFMGLTVACARCHDHKYDPIPTVDYYSMYGVLASCDETKPDDNPPGLADKAEPVNQVVFLRGNAGAPGPPAPRQFFECLSRGDRKPFATGSGRLEMAQAIANRDNPLTARVWVNRVWGHLFGRGIVATPSDFGARGTPPTHPELLDWLATTFIDDGWSTKRLIRRIVLSNAYRQASDVRPDAEQADAENLLVWRMNRRRLDLEALRDSMLTAAGRLDLTMGGPSVQITTAPFSTRRSVYGFIERQNMPAFFRTFDFANPNAHTPQRPETASPQQALFMLNSPFALEQSRELAKRSAAAPDSDEARIGRLYQATLERDPTADEVADVKSFLAAPVLSDAGVIPGQTPWRFGWGAYDPLSDRVDYHPLPAFVNNNSWQGSAALPDPTLGWVSLNAQGGHPGDATHQVIRRWIAPAAGTLRFAGTLTHPESKGDGVRARVVSSARGRAGEWSAVHGAADTNVDALPVSPGDAIDLVVDCQGDFGYDTFAWTAELRLDEADGHTTTWKTAEGFHGQPPPQAPLDRWEELTHVLLMCNEFIFVD